MENKEAINGEPSPYLIHCVKDEDFGSCGESSYLTKEQYNRQMMQPDKGWQCPICGCYPCHWDDVNYDKWQVPPKGKEMVTANLEETEKIMMAYEAERIYTPEECQKQMEQMKDISSKFYTSAIRIKPQHHAFIEFTGFMNKYIDLFAKSMKLGIDPNACNTHIGLSLLGVEEHDVKYFAEKLDCILGSTPRDPKLRKAFFEEMGWPEKVEIPNKENANE